MDELSKWNAFDGLISKIEHDLANIILTKLKLTGKNAIELETMVCSAAGTTIEGVKALHDGGLPSTLMDAVAKAAARSTELENEALR